MSSPRREPVPVTDASRRHHPRKYPRVLNDYQSTFVVTQQCPKCMRVFRPSEIVSRLSCYCFRWYHERCCRLMVYEGDLRCFKCRGQHHLNSSTVQDPEGRYKIYLPPLPVDDHQTVTSSV